MARVVDRFHGHILGAGSTSGVRVVVGRWDRSTLGDFADVMVADADGRRLLLAPSDEVAEYVSATYSFDEVVRCPVTVVEPGRGTKGWTWEVGAGPLSLVVGLGGRTRTGTLLRAVPAPFAGSRAAAVLGDPVARLVHPGVRTAGSAGGGRREYYGARDQWAVTSLDGTWRGEPLGALAPVDPPPSFGFSSTPRPPSLTRVTTTVTRPTGAGGGAGSRR